MGDKQTTCIERVSRDAWSSSNCSRMAGFGPDGAYCRQHGEKRTPGEITATWYKTSNWRWTIEAVGVIRSTEKTVVVQTYTGKSRQENIHSQSESYWPTRQAAIEHLRERLERKREVLAKDEQEFQLTVNQNGTEATQ